MIDLIANQDEIVITEEPRLYMYRWQKYRSLTDRIRDAGFGEDFSTVPPAIMERAQQRGRAVHLACHFYDEGDLDLKSVHSAIGGYIEAYIRFVHECPGKIVAVETKLIATLKIPTLVGDLIMGCTPDVIRFVRGRRSVIERKTSQVIGKGAQIQTRGQQVAWNAVYPKQPVLDRYGLRLQSDGYYKLIAHEDPDDGPAFMDALAYSVAKEKRDGWLRKYGH